MQNIICSVMTSHTTSNNMRVKLASWFSSGEMVI